MYEELPELSSETSDDEYGGIGRNTSTDDEEQVERIELDQFSSWKEKEWRAGEAKRSEEDSDNNEVRYEE